MTMKAVGTAAMEMVQEVEAQFDEVCVCVCVFVKLHTTAQSGPVILLIVILCHTRVCVCVYLLNCT